jgi:hypothetical protein
VDKYCSFVWTVLITITLQYTHTKQNIFVLHKQIM